MDKVLELPALRKDGKELSVELSLAPVCLQAKWHAVGIVRDITEAQAGRANAARQRSTPSRRL